MFITSFIIISYFLMTCIYCQKQTTNNQNYPICKLATEIYKLHSLNDMTSDQQCIDTNCNFGIFQNSSSIIVIGDVHGSYNGLLEILVQANIIKDSQSCEWSNELVTNERNGITLVQMGDLVDRGPGAYESNLCLWKLQQSSPKGSSLIRLVGNHELWWLEGNLWMKNKVHDTQEKVNSFNKNIKNDILEEKVVGAYHMKLFDVDILFTHAGINPQYLSHLKLVTGVESPDHIQAFINDQLKARIHDCVDERAICNFENDELFEAGPERGGKGIGGPFWNDFSGFQKRNSKSNMEMIQIVGHTASSCAYSDDSIPEDCIRFTKSEICVDGGMYMGSRSYLEINNQGHFLSHQKDALSWTFRDITQELCE